MGTHRHVVHHRVHHVVSNALQGVRQGHGPPLGRGDSASRREGQHPPSGAQRSRRCPSHEGDRALERSLQGVHRFAQEALRARQGCSLEARAKSVPPKEPPPHTHTRAFPSSLSPGIEGKGRGHQIEKKLSAWLLGRSLLLSAPQSLHLQNGDDKLCPAYFMGLL